MVHHACTYLCQVLRRAQQLGALMGAILCCQIKMFIAVLIWNKQSDITVLKCDKFNRIKLSRQTTTPNMGCPIDVIGMFESCSNIQMQEVG